MLRYSIPMPKTKKIVLWNILKFKEKDTNSELKNLSLNRKQVEDSISRSFNGIEAIVREDLVKIEAYLLLLQNLIDNLNKPYNHDISIRFIKNLRIRWSSALTLDCKSSNGLSLMSIFQRKKSPTFFQICWNPQRLIEKPLVFFDYLCKIRPPDYSPWVPIEKLPELTSSVCSSLSLLCLAEGQAVTASKAKEKGTSASLLTKLHYGVSQYVDEANASLLSKTNIPVKELLSRLLDYVSTLGALHELKSGKHLAESLESEGQVGEAIGVLRRALARAKKTTQFRDDSWKSVFNKEREEVTTLMNKYERLNKSMMLQRIPLEAELPNLQGDMIVKLIPYLATKSGKELNFEFP